MQGAGLTTGDIPRTAAYHVSALIAANVDVVQISRRIGHGSPAVTLRIYAHLFKSTDTAAAAAIEAALKSGREG
jgi:integrase